MTIQAAFFQNNPIVVELGLDSVYLSSHWNYHPKVSIAKAMADRTNGTMRITFGQPAITVSLCAKDCCGGVKVRTNDR